MRQLEICVDTFSAARTAAESGATRLELCSDLSVGGLTPDPGLIDRVMTGLDIPVQIMIRPRSGGFIYLEDEIATMKASISFISKQWPDVRGFVTGALRPTGQIDSEAMRELQRVAGDHPITFHRAFDRTPSLMEALETCVHLGIERILTSGGEKCVDDGIARIVTLNAAARDRIVILPGGGVNRHNARLLLTQAKVNELHLSARKRLSMGSADDDNAYEADADVIKSIRALLTEVCE